MFSVQQLLDNWIQSLQKTAVLHCVCEGLGAMKMLPLTVFQAFPYIRPSTPAGTLAVHRVCSMWGHSLLRARHARDLWCREGPCPAAPRPWPPFQIANPISASSAPLSCVCVGVIPLDPASPALQQAGQLTQVSGVLNGGLLLSLEEPSKTQGEPEAVPDVNRST